MNKYKYIYIFSVRGQLVHSCETAMTIMSRCSTEEDKDAVRELIDSNQPGNYTILTTGEYVIQSS